MLVSGVSRKCITLLALILLGSCGGGSSSNSGTAPVTCLAGAGPQVSDAPVSLQRVYAGVSFSQATGLYQVPGNNEQWYVLEKAGRIYRFDNFNNVSTTELLLDIPDRVNSGFEGGLLGMAFDPDFKNNAHVYLSYTTSDNPASNDTGDSHFRSVISRVSFNAERNALDMDSEKLILELPQPFGNHNGGHIVFGPDGYLYIGFGDGGGSNRLQSQDTSNLYGALLRIDVTDVTETATRIEYTIPVDNPLTGDCDGSTACPEIYAWGFRNPWRWSFDRNSADLWLADVGQNQWEEVNVINKGGNYGWPCYEGNHIYSQSACVDDIAYEAPVIEYDHSQGNSITGGYVYHGSDVPGLSGQYVFGDYVNGRVWRMTGYPEAPQREDIENLPIYISSFAEDQAGELYVLSYGNGAIYKFTSDSKPISAGFADQLSASGCAMPDDPKQAASNMLPYDINARLWSDGAIKQRWFALPENGRIHVREDGDWEFPIGSVLRKDFYLNGRIIETRLLAHHEDGKWAGYSYEWNDDQTDATLYLDGLLKTIDSQAWTYPSSSQCLQCHTQAANRSLGPETGQLNRDYTYPDGQTRNQLTYYQSLGLFDSGLPVEPEQIADPADNSATTENRARAYLHANCSHCHRPGGPGQASIDLRYTTGVAGMGICNALPSAGDLGIANARLLVPADPSRSILSERMKRTDDNRMPDLGSVLVDEESVALIDAWINSLSACP